MKNLRNFSSAVALSIALATCSTSQANEQINQAVNQTQVELADTLHQIRVDAASAEAVNPSLMARIDALVVKIDAALATKPENEADLVSLRKTALEVRSQISKAMGGATNLVNQLIEGQPVFPNGEVVGGDGTGLQPSGEFSTQGGTSYSGGNSFGGGGGGGGVGAGGGGIGGLAALGGIGAAAAFGINNNTSNTPGIPSSPSAP